MVNPMILERDAPATLEIPSGYLHPLYAQSLCEFGRPLELSRCKGWVLERQIPGFADCDLTGCYPVFSCQDWSQLHLDLEDLGDEIVCLSLVTDPFGSYDESYLKRCFKDVVLAFKEHYVVDLQDPIENRVSRNMRHNIRRALRNINVEVCQNPRQFLDDWDRLYGRMIERFHIRSIRAFSRSAFIRQFDLPGFIMYRAEHAGEIVGIEIVIAQGEAAFGHLIGIDDIGYRLGVSDVLYWNTIHDLSRRGLRWYDIGGTPGVLNGERDSLKGYKLKWATGTRTAYFCGRIYNPRRYGEIVQATGAGETSYFPAYRVGEMG
jgi:hypothetical protein